MKRRQGTEAIQYTLRNVPQGVDRALRQRAKQLSRSLNDVAVEALMRGVGAMHEPTAHHDLDFLVGSWVDDSKVDDALQEQRQIEAELWR